MNQIKIGAGVGCGMAILGAVIVVCMAGASLFGMFLDVIGPDLFVAFMVIIFTCFAGAGLLRVMAWVARAWWEVEAERERAIVVREFVYPDNAGLMPLSAERLRSRDGTQLAMKNNMMSHWKVKIEPDVVPKSLTYAPHVIYKNQSTGGTPNVDPALLLEALDVQSISQLWAKNELPNSGFLVGYDLETHEPVMADWKKLYSALIGGQSGAGKTTLIRSLLAQSALQGGRFVLIDPHSEAGEESMGSTLAPLRHLMLCDVAVTEQQIIETLAFVDGVGQRRLKGLERDRTPLVLVVDETTSLLQRSEVAEALIQSLAQISQETRKVGVYAFCIGQNWSGEILPTVVRNSFVSQISCRARRDVARVQSGNSLFGKAVEKLDIGQCVWMTPRGEMWTLQVPNCTEQDLETIATQINGKTTYTVKKSALPVVEATSRPTSQATSRRVDVEVKLPKDEGASEVAGEVAFTSREARVRDMITDGKSATDIIKAIWGVAGGKGYQKAAAEYQAIVQKLIGGKNG